MAEPWRPRSAVPRQRGPVRQAVQQPAQRQAAGGARQAMVLPSMEPDYRTPENVQGVTNTERGVINNLGGTPRSIVKWLEEKGYEAHHLGDDNYAVRRAGTRDKFGVVDPSGIMDWFKDLTLDAGDEYAKIKTGAIGGAAGAIGGSAMGGPVGGFVGAMGGAGAAVGATEGARQVASRAAGFDWTPEEHLGEVGKEFVAGAAGEGIGRIVSKAIPAAASAAKRVYRGATNYTRGEVQEMVGGVGGAQLQRARKGVGIPFKPGQTSDEIAEAAYLRQRAAPEIDAENAARAGKFIDDQSPGRFNPDYQWDPKNGPQPVGWEHPLDTKEPFAVKAYSESSKRSKEYTRDLYGAPPGRMSADEWEKLPLNQLRGLVKNTPGIERELGKPVARASKRELAQVIEEIQPGGTSQSWHPNQTRAKDLADNTRTVFRGDVPPFSDTSGGYRKIKLSKVQKLESGSQGKLDFDKPSVASIVMRKAIGKHSYGEVPTAAKALGKVGSALSYFPDKLVTAAKNHPMAGVAMAMRYPRLAKAVGGIDLGGAAFRGAARFVAGEPGPWLSKIVYDPGAPAGVRSLAQKAMDMLKRNPKRAAAIMQVIARSPYFRAKLEAEGKEHETEG